VADSIYNCATSKQNDTIVGLPFAAAAAANQLTGGALNPFASPLPFM